MLEGGVGEVDLPEPFCSSDFYFFRQRFMRNKKENENEKDTNNTAG